ncbi:hypothetical protein PoB_007509800 [Plakobranchus ocellatus]|uniref:Uncharacterized protein n=1 Tax=Plakobranchus ocellatus TaxID=259542 RepID=A0AAV4DWV6_9GAST|nr:hypothetical protein PoB_007509800 [Plakobranchus ocellatus]
MILGFQSLRQTRASVAGLEFATDLRADSLATVPPRPPNGIERRSKTKAENDKVFFADLRGATFPFTKPLKALVAAKFASVALKSADIESCL